MSVNNKTKIFLSKGQIKKMDSCVKLQKPCKLLINPNISGNQVMFLTNTQIKKLSKAKEKKKSINIEFSVAQINKQDNHDNVKKKAETTFKKRSFL